MHRMCCCYTIRYKYYITRYICQTWYADVLAVINCSMRYQHTNANKHTAVLTYDYRVHTDR